MRITMDYIRNSFSIKNWKFYRKDVALVFLLANIIFLVLYRQYIFGDSAYVFNAIGFDTISQYFPYYVFEGEQIRTGNIWNYSLQMGLGGFPFTQNISLLNPFDFVILFCDNSNMYIGILLSLYLKTIFISIVSFFYFDRLFVNRYTKIACAIIWTYCSYITLWGQHYAFGTNMAYFTLFMLGLQAYLESDKIFCKSLPLIIFLFILQSYYFLYMVGFYSVIYIIVYYVLKKASLKECIKKIFGLGCMAILGVLMAGFSVFVSIGSFLGSSRSNGISFQMIDKIFDFRSFTYIFTVITRLLSNNVLGTENYAGWANYYEAPMLFTSGLFIYSMVYSLLGKEKRKKCCIYLIGIFSVLSAFCSIVLTGFAGEYLRWTFMLCFSMVISVGVMLDNIIDRQEKTNKKNILVAGIGIVIYFVLYAFVQYGIKKTLISIDRKAILYSAIFAIIYAVYILLINQKTRKIYTRFLLATILLEMMLCNESSVNQRDMLTKQETKIYQTDEAMQHVNYIKKQDAEIYRIKKTYGVVQLNDALAQGFNGLSSYYSVIPASINQYVMENQIPPMLYNTCIDFPWYRYVINTLLGEKYLIANRDLDIDETLYEIVNEAENTILYKNKYALPFGYFYYNNISKSEINELNEIERDFVLTDRFYYTDELLVDTKELEIWKGQYDSKQSIQEEVKKSDESQLRNNINNLAKNSMKNIQFSNNTLSGYVENNPQKAMLCVPIFFEKNWNAYVDGVEQEVYSINGGLLGIGVPEGNHEIQIVYNNIFFDFGCKVSILAWLLYFLVFLIRDIKKLSCILLSQDGRFM